MLRRVPRLRRIAAAASFSVLFISTASALSMATSVPAPMATPVSAAVSAGASFMPSPTIATLPSFCSSRMTCCLPSGSTPAMVSSTPACAPMAAAVRLLSPVSMTTLMPSFSSSAIASAESRFTVSATAITPSSLPSSAKKSGVLPCSESASAARLALSGTETAELIYLALPPNRGLPMYFAVRPLPLTAEKSATSEAETPRSSPSATIALASGCSLFRSSEKAFSMSSASVTPSAGTISVTFGSPVVMVPVLSSATIFVLPADSSASPVLKSMPFLAPRPLPTIIATGVARPSAQGHDMTSTEMPRASAKLIPRPAISQPMATIAAMMMTAGTNTPETLSAILAIGALVAAASETVFIICARVVSCPTLVARQVMKPERFIVAALTVLPSALSTGIDSPVSADSSTAEAPETTTPSTGTLSPGRTTKISPTATLSISTSRSAPSLITTAFLGASFRRLFNALVVRPFESDSSSLPTVMSAGIIAADSK